MKKLTYRFLIRNGYLYLKITFNRKHFSKSCGLKISEKVFNETTQKVKGRSEIARQADFIINYYSAKINTLSLKQLNGKVITERDVKKIISSTHASKNTTDTDFYDFYKNDLLPRKQKELRYGGWKKYLTEYRKLKEFDKNLCFGDFSEKLINDYIFFLRNKKNNCENTIHRAIRLIKAVLNDAVKNELIDKNPIENFKTKFITGYREFLTQQELIMLHEKLNVINDLKLNKVLRYFLFACYTGLRFSDVKQLTWNHIEKDYIRIKMIKTSTEIFIPINNRARSILEMQDTSTYYVFNTYSNQKTNQYLKQIALITDINKNLTFHVARHTFATVSIEIGIPIEVVSKLLGHADLKTTLIYARIVDNVKVKEMQKWNF